MGRYGRGEGLEVLLAGVKELQAWKTHGWKNLNPHSLRLVDSSIEQ